MVVMMSLGALIRGIVCVGLITIVLALGIDRHTEPTPPPAGETQPGATVAGTSH